MRTDDMLMCRDRAVGHDWDTLRWEDGSDLRRGRRTIYVVWRVARCTRCTTERREIFEHDHRTDGITKIRNDYTSPKEYKELGRMTQQKIHSQLWRHRKGAKR